MATNKPNTQKSNKPKVNILRPCMREKKRYLAYELMSDKPLQRDADRQLIARINDLLGVFNTSKAGIMPVKYNPEKQRGLLKVERKFVDFVRACFVMIKSLNNQEVLIRTLYVSGMLNRAGEHIN
ncbi:MAG: Rpp14/Pop5 family protein [archaeon]